MYKKLEAVFVAAACAGLLLGTSACGSDSSGGRSSGGVGGTGGTGGTGGSGGSGTGGGATYTSTYPSDTPLSSLTDGEIVAECEASTEAVMDAVGLAELCKYDAFMAMIPAMMDPNATDAALQAACQDGLDACVTAGQSTLASDSGCTPPAGECTATIGDVEACMAESQAALEELLSQLPECSTVTMAGVAALADLTEPATPACDALDAACP